MLKPVKDLKAGDVVAYYGGQFLVVKDAYESNSHRPQAGHLATAPGPADCAVAKALCVAGEVPGYFRPGSEWTFQGSVEVKHVVTGRMERNEQLRAIYRWTHSDFKGRIDGVPYILVFRNGTCSVPLDSLTDEEIADKLPLALKKDAERKAKAAAVKEAV